MHPNPYVIVALVVTVLLATAVVVFSPPRASTATRRPPSMLAKLHADWTLRGWDLSVLSGFRMEVDVATLTIEQLGERRTALLDQLNDPNFDGDINAVLAEADAVAAAIASSNDTAARVAETRSRLMGLTPRPGIPAQPLRPDEAATFADIAQRFVESEAFQNFRANGYKGRTALDLFQGEQGTRLAEALGLEVRAPIDNTGTSAGAFQNPTRPATIPVTNADRPLRLFDLIDRQTTGDNTVEYVRETSAAAAGGAAAEVAEGGAKPEATITFEVITDSVRTVAHWVQITRQAADDNQQVMGYIRGRLRYGLEFRLDAQIINGNGTAPNLRGILNTTGRNTYAPGVAEARVISIRKAMTTVEVDEYAATAAVLHPTDWELVELSTSDDGMFRVSPNVASAMGRIIWGLRVVTTTAIAAGKGLVGDFRLGATLWDRMQPQLFITDSHASTFTSNILTLLMELRAALSVWRPSAFCEITFNGAD